MTRVHDFLLSLLRPKETPRVPSAVRREASDILKHFPYPVEIAEKWASPPPEELWPEDEDDDASA